MQKKLITLLFLASVLVTVGCGGSMVGEDAPAYRVSPLLKETTSEVIFGGNVTCQDGQTRNFTLTIQITDKDADEAQFTMALDGGTIAPSVVNGTFKEGNNGTVLVYSDRPINVQYGTNPNNNNNPYTNQLLFDNAVDTTTLIYSGDPSLAEVQMNPPARTICHLEWTEEAAADDGDDAAEERKVKRPVNFNTIRTQ